MRLTRNLTTDGKCKYALVRMDRVRANQTGEEFCTEAEPDVIQAALDLLHKEGLLEYGEPGTKEEFFAIKLKDENAAFALRAYAIGVLNKSDDKEYAKDVFALADRADAHPNKKRPDTKENQ